ncbi:MULTISPECIES: hypothetical protein [unclassified Streptomyces]|uniref:hypothetical protein n=1 Tax=unclassified Streptomyces TaxID=2593676 RepID=UPI002238C11A|nr:hypothetical protein [Streptomyces sp. SHP 1-2]MCW5251215.1 hypothetical protein [Streptomyces sp. SHP 1-2]
MTVWTTAAPDSPAPSSETERAEDFLRALRGSNGQTLARLRARGLPGLADDFDPRDPGTILSLALSTLRCLSAPAARPGGGTTA